MQVKFEILGVEQHHKYDNPCEKNPCQNIAKAVVNSCHAIGTADFECMCQNSKWDDDTNSCAMGKKVIVKK